MTGCESDARSVEEILLSLLADGRCKGFTIADLARDYRVNSISMENARIVDAVVKLSWEIRQSIGDEVAAISKKLSLTAEQECGLLDAVIGGGLFRVSQERLPQASFKLCKSYDIALGGLASLVGGADRWGDLWEVVRSVLVTEARFLMKDEPVSIVIASRDGFTNVISNRIAERLMMDPAVSQAFLRQLTDDLAAFLSKGNKLSGAWGEIALQDDSLVFRLAAREKVA